MELLAWLDSGKSVLGTFWPGSAWLRVLDSTLPDIKAQFLQGRWACKCQIAGDNYQDPEMSAGNFIMFSNDMFGVIFLELQAMSLFKRVTNL